MQNSGCVQLTSANGIIAEMCVVRSQCSVKSYGNIWTRDVKQKKNDEKCAKKVGGEIKQWNLTWLISIHVREHVRVRITGHSTVHTLTLWLSSFVWKTYVAVCSRRCKYIYREQARNYVPYADRRVGCKLIDGSMCSCCLQHMLFKPNAGCYQTSPKKHLILSMVGVKNAFEKRRKVRLWRSDVLLRLRASDDHLISCKISLYVSARHDQNPLIASSLSLTITTTRMISKHPTEPCLQFPWNKVN